MTRSNGVLPGKLGSLALALGMLALPLAAHGQTYKQLYSFHGGKHDGDGPYYGLLIYAGNLYGTTYFGGAHGKGTVFELSANGQETILHSFDGRNDGNGPGGPLVADGSGNLYGPTYLGGLGGCKGDLYFGKGCGTTYKLAPDGTLTLLRAFEGGGHDGARPEAGVIMDAGGNLYGTTSYGGKGSCSFYGEPRGCGTVFEIAADGAEQVLYSFKGGATDGEVPFSNIVMDASGNLYGMTTLGGAKSADCAGGCGTVFKLDSSGNETLLYTFCSQANCADGGDPFQVNPILDGSGNLYGTTMVGGANDAGVVFRVSPGGAESVLYSFCSAQGCSDGNRPNTGVIADKSGNLYGTTSAGGVQSGDCMNGCGTVFRLAPDGTETVLYTFCSEANCADGAEPGGGLIMDGSGNLYGTTDIGGTDNRGTVFEITP